MLEKFLQSRGVKTINLLDKISELEKLLEQATEKIQHLQQEGQVKDKIISVPNTDPIELIRKISHGTVEWFDYLKLDQGQRAAYYNDAQVILRSEVFENEIAGMIKSFGETVLRHATDHKMTNDLRMQLAGAELLRERLRQIPNPNQIPKRLTDPFSPI